MDKTEKDFRKLANVVALALLDHSLNAKWTVQEFDQIAHGVTYAVWKHMKSGEEGSGLK